MSKSEISGLPPFFNKEEGTDAGHEAVQDFYLSWILRCADVKYKEQNHTLYEYARTTVFLLIHGDNIENGFVFKKEISTDAHVTNVRILRQLQRIDLIAEIDTIEDSKPNKYVLNIENKWYANVRENQLADYVKVVAAKYGSTDFAIRNLVIFCDESGGYIDPNQIKICENYNYKWLSIGDIQVQTKMRGGVKTGNFMFDEFWHEDKYDKQ